MSRRRRLIAGFVSIPALGAIASLAGNSPAETPDHAEAARRQIARADSAPPVAIATRSADAAPTRPPSQPPPAATAITEDTRLDTAPPRRAAGLELIRNGWIYDCRECHTLLRAQWRYDRPFIEHHAVELEHGNNRYCLNCHHPTNRNAFVDYDGAEIAQGDTIQLCAKCHGTTFRDWQAGVHGRQNGHWRAQAGEKTRLGCTQCHAPHQPKFPQMKPLAPLRYPPRAAGAPRAAVSSSAFRVPSSMPVSSVAELPAPNSELRAESDPKPATRNPKLRLARSATAPP